MDGVDTHYTIIGQYLDSGDTTVAIVPFEALRDDPHLAALRQAGRQSSEGPFEIVAVLRGRCEVLATQQSLRIYSERLIRR